MIRSSFMSINHLLCEIGCVGRFTDNHLYFGWQDVFHIYNVNLWFIWPSWCQDEEERDRVLWGGGLIWGRVRSGPPVRRQFLLIHNMWCWRSMHLGRMRWKTSGGGIQGVVTWSHGSTTWGQLGGAKFFFPPTDVNEAVRVGAAFPSVQLVVEWRPRRATESKSARMKKMQRHDLVKCFNCL